MTHTFSFCVRGFGRFPIDMLRYDHCWPAAEHDSITIATTITTPKSNQETVPYVVTLLVHSSKAAWPCLTHSRWESFGWEVLPATYKKLA